MFILLLSVLDSEVTIWEGPADVDIRTYLLAVTQNQVPIEVRY